MATDLFDSAAPDSEDIVVLLDYSYTCSKCGERGAALFGRGGVPLCFDHARDLPEEDWRYAAKRRIP